MLAKGVFGKTETLMLCPYILFLFHFNIWLNKPHFNIRKFLKYLGIFMDLFMGSLRFILFFFFCDLFFFSAIWSIRGPLLLNANLLCNVFFLVKRENNKKGKQKEKGIEKLFLLH
jgi:hypothetical protein